ncbi:sugar ABC transporter permease [Nesterenkonia flava]|uniref:Sugar ABC transporter permease n=1 Tax=Nesterenkonia flava TaxID=469799 RepID=A0ABU1FSD4_9MICC|nr:sugar ABC transporter permease [Nesterenkonia flava]
MTPESPTVTRDIEAAPASDEGKQTERGGRRIWGRLVPYLYIAPGVALLLLWTYWPLARTFELSFYDWNLLPNSPREFIGLQNYQSMLSHPEMRQATINTGVYIVAFSVFSLVLPVLIALLSQQVRGRWKTFYQALIFVPFLLTPVATSAVWRWLYAENGGAIPRLLGFFGVEVGNVFRDPSVALLALTVIVGWQLLGFGVLVVSAGIAGINPDYAHAASLDGARSSDITRRITLPLLSPTLLFLGLMTLLLSAQWTFPIIDILTRGGPSNSTTNVYYVLYQFGFQNFDAGLSAAAGVLFFIVFGVIGVLFVELTDRFAFYDN